MKGLGGRIRRLRKDRKLTLVDVSKKTRIDQATLSRIETGKMRGTLDSHMKIAEALGIRLPELYEDVLSEMEEAKEKTTRRKIETFSHSNDAVAEILTTDFLRKKMMPILLKIKPKGRTTQEEYPTFTERFVYVLKGALEICAGTETQTLNTGESSYLDASTPHHFKNSSKSEVWCLSVMTPTSP